MKIYVFARSIFGGASLNPSIRKDAEQPPQKVHFGAPLWSLFLASLGVKSGEGIEGISLGDIPSIPSWHPVWHAMCTASMACMASIDKHSKHAKHCLG